MSHQQGRQQKQSSKLIHGIPTNIVTGFLGAGKTSTILHLLNNKPSNERWAVLVNEFGEIGIDGALIQGQVTGQKEAQTENVFIREVPGGCMCCTAGLPMRVALTQLIRQAKPDRLLIEPTGLGHPQEVLQTLKETSFKGVLAIQQTITLIDARQLSDQRYAEHETFQQQIDIADIIVANKQDLYSDNDKTVLTQYLQTRSLHANIIFTQQGAISNQLLDRDMTDNAHSIDDNSLANQEPSAGKEPSVSRESSALTPQSTVLTNKKPVGLYTHFSVPPTFEATIPECGFIKAKNSGEGFTSIGWRFTPQFEFDQNKLFIFLSGINAERVKATFITNNGNFAYNLTPDALTEVPLNDLYESRIEIIAEHINTNLEKSLFNCATKANHTR